MLAGTVKVVYEHLLESETDLLKFQLYPNAYRQDSLYPPIAKGEENTAYYQGESYGEIVISSVNGAKNWEVMGEDENILYVRLPQSLFYGDKTVLDIGFMVKLANVNHRTGITPHTVNLSHFYPVLCAEKNGGFYECAYYNVGEPFLQSFAEYKLSLKLPKEYTVACTGEITSERMLESKKEYTMYATNVQDLALTLSKKYKILQMEENGKVLSYYYYQDKTPKDTLETARECFAYFEKTFGEYPYHVYTLAETGLCFGGETYPMLTRISDDLEENARAKEIVRQTARQWWSMSVGCNRVENAWLDIGLSEYTATTFFEGYEKYGVTRETLVQESLKEYRSYYDVYGSVLGRTDTAMNRHLKDFISGYEYRCLEYDKAIVMFDTLRKSVGEKQFFSGLKRYYKENALKRVIPENLIGAFERSGVDSSGFFESFLNGKAIL